MKKLLFIFIAVFYASFINAQYFNPPTEIPLNKFKVLDSAQLKFTYFFSYKKSYSRNESDTAFIVDKQVLLAGKNVSKYYSQYYLDCCERVMKKVMNIPMEGSACSFEVFKNYPANKVTVTEQAGSYFYGGNYIYNEDKPEFKWTIDKDTMTLLGYTCQKATTTFRGRNYTAWFAPEIPSSNGPWKFGGLPGLILKISDDKRNFIFECSGIQQLEKPEPIKVYTLNYTEMSRQGMDKLYRRFFKDPIQFWKNIRSEFLNDVDISDIHIPKMIYNPIEFE